MQQRGANILPATPPPTPPGSKGQNSTFSEYGHVAYKIYTCSNMEANILPAEPPTLGMVSKFIFFWNMFMLHIK